MKKMTSKSPSVCSAGNLSAAPDVKAGLPNVMIEYLWKLALCDEWKNCEKQLFILQIGELSGQDIQDIYHVYGLGSSMEVHRVYGIVPVNCRLQVLNTNGCYHMQFYEGTGESRIV